jgi:hypothetical protein
VKWQALQTFVWVGFVFANIYFDWQIPGLAAGVMGGMLALYVTRVISVILERFAGRSTTEGLPASANRAARRLDRA